MSSLIVRNRRKRSNIHHAPDINVTPFVDVLLVLLIIFMIASPAIISGMNINLPQGKNHDVKLTEKNITITIDASGVIYLDDVKISLSNLSNSISNIAKKETNPSIFVRGDISIRYGRVMEVVNNLALSGYSKIILVTNDSEFDNK